MRCLPRGETQRRDIVKEKEREEMKEKMKKEINTHLLCGFASL
jgi:hypothetical protein